ncbi:MAG: hypothetical protein R3F56_10935 [Planctomycetota bacterium]
MRNTLSLVAAAVAATSLAQAQVDVLYTNISSTAGAYTDCVVLWNTAGQRPFAQQSHGATATGSARKMKARTVGGSNYLYWYDIIVDDLVRGTDANRNGVIDPTEFQVVFDQPASSDGSIDEDGGVWWNGIGASAIGELWRLQDLNADGDCMDAGESTQVVAGPTVDLPNVSVTGVSSNNISSVVMMANGDCVWYPKGTTALPTHALIRTTAAGVSSLYMAPVFAAITRSPALPTQPDFGGSLPASINTNPLDRLAVDRANDAVFAAVNFTSAAPQQPWVFRCKDGNSDGDANDAGEVTLFYDGNTGPVPITTIDDIEWLNGKLYVSHEFMPNAGPCQFVELVDLNNDGDAMDAGEQTILGGTSTAPLDDPTVLGITVVPSGFFGPDGCVSADLRDNGMVAAGGNLTLTFGDIPVAQQSPTTLCVGALSLTGDFGVPLPGGCILGLFPDALTTSTISFLIAAGPTTRTQALPSLPYPPLPAGLRIYAAGFFFDAGTLTIPGVTHSNLIVVQ